MSVEALSQIDGKKHSGHDDTITTSNKMSDSKASLKSDAKFNEKNRMESPTQEKRVNVFIRVRGDNINDIDQCNLGDNDVESVTWRPNLLDGGKWSLDGPSSESAVLTQFPMCRELLKRTHIVDFQFTGHNVIVYTFGPQNSGKTYSLLGAKTAEIMRQKSSSGMYKVAHVQIKETQGSNWDSLHARERGSIGENSKLENSILNASMQTIGCMSTDLATIAGSASYAMSEFRPDTSNEFNISRLYMESINCVGIDQLAQHYGHSAPTPLSAKKSGNNAAKKNSLTNNNTLNNGVNTIIKEGEMNSPKSLRLDPESGLLWHYLIELFMRINKERRNSRSVPATNTPSSLSHSQKEQSLEQITNNKNNNNYSHHSHHNHHHNGETPTPNNSNSSSSPTPNNGNAPHKYVYISAVEFFNHEWYDLLGRELNNVDTVEHARFLRASTLDEAFHVVRSIRARRLELFVPGLTSSISHFVIQVRLQSCNSGPIYLYSTTNINEIKRDVISTAFFIDMASCFYSEKDRPELSKTDVTNYLCTLDSFQECMQNIAMGEITATCASPLSSSNVASPKGNNNTSTPKKPTERRNHERWEKFLMSIIQEPNVLPHVLGLYTIPSSESLSLNADLSLRCAHEIRSCAARQARHSIHKITNENETSLVNETNESDKYKSNNEVPIVNKIQSAMLTPSPPPPYPLQPGSSLPSKQRSVADKNVSLPPNSSGQRNNSSSTSNININSNSNNMNSVPFNRHQLYDGVAPRPPAKSNSVHSDDLTPPIPIPLPEFPRGTLNINNNNYHNNNSNSNNGGGNRGESYPSIVNGRSASSSESENTNRERLARNKSETSRVNNNRNGNVTAATCNGNSDGNDSSSDKSYNNERESCNAQSQSPKTSRADRDTLPPLPVIGNFGSHFNSSKDTTPTTSCAKETFLPPPSSIASTVATSMMMSPIENHKSSTIGHNRLAKSVNEHSTVRPEVMRTDVFISAQNTNSINVPNKGMFGFGVNEMMVSEESDYVIGEANSGSNNNYNIINYDGDNESIITQLPSANPAELRLTHLNEDEEQFRRSLKTEEAERWQELTNGIYEESKELIKKIKQRESMFDEPQLRKKNRVQATELDKLRMSTLGMNLKEWTAAVGSPVPKETSFLSKLTLKKKRSNY